MIKWRVLTIGLDGATWDLLKPWAQKRALPTIQKMVENGVHGILKSTIPPVTGPAWVSFATGKNPGKHGCYDFVLPKASLSDIHAITSLDIGSETFYETLNSKGFKCVIVNLPVSHPPRIEGTIVTSLMTKGDNFLFPPSLKDEIPEFKNYRIVPNQNFLADGKLEEYFKDIRKLEMNRFKCAKKLFKRKWDFFFILFSCVDWIQHQIFNKLISGEVEESSEAFKTFQDLDMHVKWFLESAPKNTIVFIMSDHGFHTYKGAFSPNSWLREKGYLRLGLNPMRNISPHLFMKKIEEARKGKTRGIHVRVPFDNFLSFPKTNPILAKLFSIVKTRLPFTIDIEIEFKQSESIAYSTSPESWGIYINSKKRFTDGKVKIDDYNRLRNEIMKKIKEIGQSGETERIFEAVLRREDVYWGEYVQLAPDIVLIPNQYDVTAMTFNTFKNDEVFDSHSMEGIFVAYGPNIRKGMEIRNAHIWDLASTILHIFNLPVFADMDGRVLKEIFEPNSDLRRREVKYQEPRKIKSEKYEFSKEEEKKIMKRLKMLGYFE